MKLNTRRILVILAEKRMTKKVLAERSGVLRQHISKILERGTCTPTTCGKLAQGLGVAVSEIMEEV